MNQRVHLHVFESIKVWNKWQLLLACVLFPPYCLECKSVHCTTYKTVLSLSFLFVLLLWSKSLSPNNRQRLNNKIDVIKYHPPPVGFVKKLIYTTNKYIQFQFGGDKKRNLLRPITTTFSLCECDGCRDSYQIKFNIASCRQDMWKILCGF